MGMSAFPFAARKHKTSHKILSTSLDNQPFFHYYVACYQIT